MTRPPSSPGTTSPPRTPVPRTWRPWTSTPEARSWLVVGALTLSAFVHRLHHLTTTPEPIGTDGYYYAVQVRSLLEEGALHVPDGSWVLRLLAACAWLVDEPILGVKVGAAGLVALAVPAAYLLGLALSSRAAGGAPPRHGSRAALALAAFVALSSSLTHLSASFPKNAGVIAPLLLGAALLLAHPLTKTRLALGALSLLLAALAHKSGAALVGLAGVGALGGWLLGRERPSRTAVLVVGGFALAFVALAALLPNLLHPSDLARITSQLDLSLHAPPPFGYLDARRMHALLQAELVFVWLPLGLALFAFVRHRERRALLAPLLLPALACVFPFFKPGEVDLGYRLAVLAPVLAAPLIVVALGPRARAPLALGSRTLALSLGLAALLPGLSRTGALLEAMPPYALYRALVDDLPRPLPKLLIAHQGLSFLYDFETRQEAMAWAPEPELDRDEIGRVVWGVRPGEWAAFVQGTGAPRPVHLRGAYFYVPERTFERLRAWADAEDDEELRARLSSWRNPTRVRPWMLKRNHAKTRTTD